jgi:hypothetical protein
MRFSLAFLTPTLSSLLNGKADLSSDMAETPMRMQSAYCIAQTQARCPCCNRRRRYCIRLRERD